ncbi:AI-2E family transporter [Clostridium sp. JN-1]|uniref:AI-2E family transporter n=1 Tax=Clostridium sp. JN-1 TaxID=2483110 RepID=UPI000F0BC6ED|nr:AI-2E family transporter [Clostridium sp. JN-1]
MNVKCKVKKYRYFFLILISLIIIYFLVKSAVMREVMYLIFISFIVSYTLKPIQKYLEGLGIKNTNSALILICALIFIFILSFSLLIPSISKESSNISDTISSIQKFIDVFYYKIKLISSNKTIYTIVNNLSLKVNNQVVSMVTKLFDSVLDLGENIVVVTIVPIISYYFLSDGDNINNKILNFFPAKSRNLIKKISLDIDKILGKYILSQLFLCAIIGAATFIILIVFKIDFPVILSMLNAFMNIIPYFGPVFGAVPIILVALLKSPQSALWVTIWLYLLQQVEGNIISPKVTGDSVSMHPLMVIILLIIGGKAAGFMGMVLAIPIGAIIKGIYDNINYYLF